MSWVRYTAYKDFNKDMKIPDVSLLQNKTYSSCLKIPNPSTYDPICIKLAKEKKAAFKVNLIIYTV